MKESLRLWRNRMLVSIIFLGLISSPILSKSQTSKTTITGKVTDETGKPLEAATVIEKGTTNGTSTKLDGSFSLAITAKNAIVISSVGFADLELATSNQKNLTVVLKKTTASLDEVVVIGYGTQKKSNVSGSVSVLKNENFQERAITRVDQALVGQVAGVTVRI
jgi:TonB-dependent starch-binding outer membrane protein SusC